MIIMFMETQNALLYGQLQSGHAFELSKAPAMSGARNYEELCIAAKNEEKKMAELKKQQHYERSRQIVPAKYSTRSSSLESSWSTDKLVNPTSNHQDAISVIVPLIWPEIEDTEVWEWRENKNFEEN